MSATNETGTIEKGTPEAVAKDKEAHGNQTSNPGSNTTSPSSTSTEVPSTSASTDVTAQSSSAESSQTVTLTPQQQLTYEQVVRKFNKLRQDQRDAANRMALLESDLTENKLVKEALLQVDGERKCFRSQGGVLIEMKVKDVIPALDKNRESLQKMITNTLKEMTDKGKEIQAFMAQNRISVQK